MSEDTQVEEGEVVGEYPDDVVLAQLDLESVDGSLKRPSQQQEGAGLPQKKQEVSKYVIEKNVGKGSYG